MVNFVANKRGSHSEAQVFERGSYTPMGAGVLLNVNGQQALEALDPEVLYHALERSVVLTKTCYYDAHTGAY